MGADNGALAKRSQHKLKPKQLEMITYYNQQKIKEIF